MNSELGYKEELLMNETKKHIGERIKEIRKKHHLKQAVLAETVEIDPKHLSKIECGLSYPSIELIDRLARALNVKPSLFFDTDHLKDKKLLIEELNILFTNADEKSVRTIYKIAIEIIK